MRKSSKIRDQLDEAFLRWASLRNQRPAKGWIRSIREALGMSGRQLAARIQVETSRISEMEKAEIQGGITLKTLRRAAEAMDCELVYALVPKTTLSATLMMQAKKTARSRLDPIDHSMRLEEQGLSGEENSKLVDKMVEEWTENPPRWLWDTR